MLLKSFKCRSMKTNSITPRLFSQDESIKPNKVMITSYDATIYGSYKLIRLNNLISRKILELMQLVSYLIIFIHSK
jgi:hypothetical protein